MSSRYHLAVESKNVAILQIGGSLRNELLFSYGTPVALYDWVALYVTADSYSKTTTAHINRFCRSWHRDSRVPIVMPSWFFDDPILFAESAEDRRIRADSILEQWEQPEPKRRRSR